MPRKWDGRRDCFLIAITLALPAWSNAQGIREMERRVDSLVAWRARGAEWIAQKQAVAAVPVSYSDTLSMLSGAVRVVLQRSEVAVARSAITRADAVVRLFAGNSMRALAGSVIAISTDPATRAINAVTVRYLVNGQDVRETKAVPANGKALANDVETYASWMLATRDKPVFAKWLRGTLPLDSVTNETWRAVRVELVSSPALIARRCYAGDLTACKKTLGLMDEADPATAWYDSAGRRAAARSNRDWTGEPAAEVMPCLRGGDSVCIELLRSSSSFRYWLEPPGSERARRALVQHAMAGHESASLERIGGAPDSVQVILGAIAEQPLDSTIAQWQRKVHGGGVESQSAPVRTVMFGLGWVVVMGALALRTPRWR